MNPDAVSVDVVYIAASSHDGRLARTCVASVRRFHPAVPIRLLAGGPLEPALVDELRRYWNVGVADLPAGDYGWGYVKLEPLFGPPGERFLVLDADTVMTGPVLRAWQGEEAPFLVDEEEQSDADARRLYYDWSLLRDVDPAAERPRFVFNSGQWFGTAGVLARADFAPWLEWTMPPRLRHPDKFMPGDQGLLNYVLNRRYAQGLEVARRKIMRWPGHGMSDLTAAAVASGEAPALIVHWAGMKTARFARMAGSDLLGFFERAYYARLPGGQWRRRAAAAQHVGRAWLRAFRLRLRLAGGRAARRLRGVAEQGPVA